jgi:hypothetical protein
VKIKVTNIPVFGYIAAEVEIPDDTSEESRQQVVADAITSNPRFLADLFRYKIESVETDDALIRGGWEFTIID